MKIVHNISTEKDDDIEKLYNRAVQNIKYVAKQLSSPLKVPKNSIKKDIEFKSNMDEKEFEEMVEKGKEYIKAGDIFQVVLSRRFTADISGIEKINFYRALRSVNPSPYMFYLHLDDIYVIGASPETLVKEAWGKATLRPIAGTRRRGRTPDDEAKMEKELLSDEKEVAEHVMLIDLGRNDLGRVCKFGSVKLTEKMIVEKYSHVMHIVSTVEGELENDKDAFDLFASAFPAGTLSGAPKIRSMEIIEELEKTKRGIYGGAIGYFSYAGSMDVCIAIRTALVKGSTIYIQAGGGIVYDSKPSLEWLETKNKSQALRTALEIASEM